MLRKNTPGLRTAASAEGTNASGNGPLFHLNSVVSQVWLMQLRKRIQVSYASGHRRLRQTGYARRSFSTFFEPLSAIESVRLFENLLRFASLEGYPPARTFFMAYAPLAFEHDASGEYIGPGVWSRSTNPHTAARRVRKTFQRWCDWLEALTHYQVDRENRPESVHRELDDAIILLWPLLQRHEWSSSEFLKVLRALTSYGGGFPCHSEQQLTQYCLSTLGLRCRRIGSDREPPQLPGFAVAERMLNLVPALPASSSARS